MPIGPDRWKGMDQALRWLRHYTLARATERAAAEAAAIGLVVAAAAAFFGAGGVEAALLGLVAGPSGAALRVLAALSTNPVSHRYLLEWPDPSRRLEVVSSSDPAGGGAGSDRCDPDGWLDGASGFRFVLRLALPGPDSEPADGVDLFRHTSGQVMVVAGDGDLTLLSKLSDGRLVVTSTALFPPRAGLLVNQIESGGMLRLTSAHRERLLELVADGVSVAATWPESVTELFRLEWDGWQQLGPFAGPLIAIDRSWWGWARFQIPIPAEALWRQATAPSRATAEPGPLATRP